MHPMLWLYRLIFLPVLIVSAPIYGWRTRRRDSYEGAFSQRMGALPIMPPKRAGCRRVWLQAVSVGELLAAGPVIDALAARPDFEVFLTTTTSTSQQLAQERYAGKVAAVACFPLDFWPIVARAWRRIQPDLVILTEGERWPEHIAQARRSRVPVICINARMSDRSFRRMRAIRALMPALMGGISRLLAVSIQDAKRFGELGFTPDQVATTGNLKVDTVIPPLDETTRTAWRTELGFGSDDLILLGASTWPGEEEALIRAWRLAKKLTTCARPLRLLVVPRHAERRAEVEAVVAREGVRHRLRTRGEVGGEVDICIADTTGELQRLTQLADIVFVGKSLRPHRNGQTPVEAAGTGRALVFGPGMANFRTIAGALEDCGAALRVSDETALVATICRLVADPAQRERLGAAGLAWHQANRGALARTLEVIEGVSGSMNPAIERVLVPQIDGLRHTTESSAAGFPVG
jgi:3-deoxy-D-manno-octulosonic-acid transferase